jgi:hypothetical protein
MKKVRAKARAVAGSHEFGVAGTGTEQVGMRVLVLDGEYSGSEFVWYGSFTEAGTDIALESLRVAGWDGTDFVNLPGLGSTEFLLTLQEEDGRDGPSRMRAAFINRLGVPMKEKMDDAAKAALARRIARITGASAAPARKVNIPF